MNRPVRMSSRCWEVTSVPAPDIGWPHCPTQQEAYAMVDGYDDLTVTVVLLPAPCWVALCGSCGGDMADEDGYRGVHHRFAFDAETGDGLTCESGCEPAWPDPLAPSSVGMEPIPGIEAAS